MMYIVCAKTLVWFYKDTWLYSGTIMENLKYGKLDATDEEVYEACKVANVDHFIRTLPDGYNMQIDEENANISQGQKTTSYYCSCYSC